MAQTPTNARRLKAAEKREICVALRRDGLTYDAIAAKTGIPRSTCVSSVRRALAQLEAATAETAEEVRRLELERLDAMLAALWPQAMQTYDLDEEGGQVALSDEARKRQHGAVAMVLKIQDRRAKLLGLDADKKLEVTGAGGGPVVLLWSPPPDETEEGA